MPPSPISRRIRYLPMTAWLEAVAVGVRDARMVSGPSGSNLLSGSVSRSTPESTPISIMQRGHEPAIGPDCVNGPAHRSHRFGSLAVMELILSAAQCRQKKADLFVGLSRCGYSCSDLSAQQLAILLSHAVYCHAQRARGQSHLPGHFVVTFGIGFAVQKHEKSVELFSLSHRREFRSQFHCDMLENRQRPSLFKDAFRG